MHADNRDRIYISSTRLIQRDHVLFTSLYHLQLPIENDLSGVTSFCTPASDGKSVNLFVYDGTLDTRTTVQYHKYNYSNTNVNMLTQAQTRLDYDVQIYVISHDITDVKNIIARNCGVFSTNSSHQDLCRPSKIAHTIRM